MLFSLDRHFHKAKFFEHSLRNNYFPLCTPICLNGDEEPRLSYVTCYLESKGMVPNSTMYNFTFK